MFKTCLTQLIDSDAVRNDLSENAYERSRNFSWESYVRQHEDLYISSLTENERS